MKLAKRILAVIMMAALAMALTIPAFAVGEDDPQYTITINGAQKDGVYKAYKVFDAAGTEDSVTYSIPVGSNIKNIDGFSGVFSERNGQVTKAKDANGDDVSDTVVIAWLKSNETQIATGTPAASVTNSNGDTSVTLNVGSAGYYFITSSVGTKAAIEITTAKPTATIEDKTETTPSNPDKKINGVKHNDMQVGEKATFTVSFTATNYATTTDENGKVVVTGIDNYIVTDTPDGFTIDESTVSVKVNDEAYSMTKNNAEQEITSTINSETGVLIVTIPWDQKTYPSPSEVVVTYEGTLTNAHLAGDSTNKAEVKYNDTKIPGDPETHTYNYTVKVIKVDADKQDTMLSGAKFVLKNTDGKFYKVAENDVVTWVNDQADATELVTDDKGIINFQGLKNGEYTLVETVAPTGYNLAADEVITLTEIENEVTDTNTTLIKEVTVADKSGVTLPSTGGIGTTIFYVAGGFLAVGAVVLMVVKKRMSAE